MKSAVLPVLIVLAVLACGCTGPAEPPAPDARTPDTETLQAVPDLTGTWTGTMRGYDEGTGFNDHPGGTMLLVIAGQHDRIFAGRLTVIEDNKTIVAENFAGALSRDGRRFEIVEESGYASGEVLGVDEIEMVYVNDAPPFSISVDSLRRV